MADQGTPTKWIVAGIALAGVVVLSVVVLAASLLGDDTTVTVPPTTTASNSTAPTTVAPSAPVTTDPPNIEVVEQSVLVGGTERTYTIISPRGARAEDPLPVVFVLHGLGVNARAMSREADWRTAVGEDRFVAVFPQGLADSWNMGPCCPPANLVGAADTAFLDLVVERVSDEPEVDAQRRFLTGFSNGALMVYSYACSRPGVFDAIAPMAGSNITGCEPSEPVSLLHQHSDPDPVVPFEGGLGVGTLISAAAFPSVPTSVASWAAADGCEEPPERIDDSDVERTLWAACEEGTRVELIRIPGAGHRWPDTGTYVPLDELLRFFDIT